MKVALYARYSTAKQDELSIDTQLMMCRRELASKGWTEIGCFTDAARSGTTMHRDGIRELMAAVERGGVQVVFADAMDRISRSQGGIATLFERLSFRGVQLVTRKEGVVGRMHIGMMGTMNAEQVSATADKTRDALLQRHSMGRNPGGIAYGYEKRIEHDSAGERIRGLVRIVSARAAIVARIFEEYASGLAPDRIAKQLNAEGIPPPGSGKRDSQVAHKPPAWSGNTITGNAARGTGILNNRLYVGERVYGKQTYRKNPDTGRRHAFLNPEDAQADVVAVPELRIVDDTLWQAVKDRQLALARGPRATQSSPTLPFFARQRPKYLLTGKMTCGECGASYAKSGKSHFGCQGSAKKGPSYCGNRLTVRQEDLDARVLKGLSAELLREDVLAVFLDEYEAETRRLEAAAVGARPEREVELADVDRQITLAKAAILKGVDAAIFAEDMRVWSARRAMLITELETVQCTSGDTSLLHADLGQQYREKVARLTAAFEDEVLRAQAFERIRALIDAVVLTPEAGELAIDLRGDLASMLELCACGEHEKSPEAVATKAEQIKLVAGTGFEPVTFRL